MNMRISGDGNIPAGEYDQVSVSGSGHLYGLVRCTSFSASGSAKGENIECADSFRISGGSSFSGNVSANSIHVSGSFSCDGNVCAKEKLAVSGSMKCAKGVKCGQISVSGSLKCTENVKCDQLSVSGGLRADADIEAEHAQISGSVDCAGLLNADTLEIKIGGGMNIGSIGGSDIVIMLNEGRSITLRLPLFSSLIKKSGKVCVESSIEGDNIALEYTVCPRVTGRVVAVGKGCEIDLLQYSEAFEISPEAKVGRTEKI